MPHDLWSKMGNLDHSGMRAKVLFFPAILVTGPTHSTFFFDPEQRSRSQNYFVALLVFTKNSKND